MAVNVITSFIPIVDANGVPYTSARVFVCTVGTTTLKTVYSDSSLTTPATNPISVSAGRHAIRFLAAGTYKIQTEINGTDTIGSGTTLANYSWDNIDPGVPVGSGALPVASGGTGATTAAAARSNLGAASATEIATVQSDISILQTRMGTTDRTRLAAGTTAQRPGSPAASDLRWNSTTSRYESYDGATWYNVMTEEEAASQAEQEAATSTTKFTTPGRQQYHPGMAKAWGVFNCAVGPTLSASHNIASVVRNGAGDYTVTFTTNMSSTTYAVVCQTEVAGPSSVAVFVIAKTASTIRFGIATFAGVASDSGNLNFVAYGDQ